MNNNGTILEVNDYLDLFLFAKSIGDQAWQDEIIHNLQSFNQNDVDHTKAIYSLWAEFNHMNKKILELYQELRISSSNSFLEGKIMELKEKRIEITRQLRNKVNPNIQAF